MTDIKTAHVSYDNLRFDVHTVTEATKRVFVNMRPLNRRGLDKRSSLLKDPFFEWLWKIRLRSPDFRGAEARGLMLGECQCLDGILHIVVVYTGRNRSYLGFAAVRSKDITQSLRAQIDIFLLPHCSGSGSGFQSISIEPDMFDAEELDPPKGPVHSFLVAEPYQVEKLVSIPDAPLGFSI